MSLGFNKYKDRGAYHWNDRDKGYDWYRELAEETVKHFPNEGTVLDVGCGDGYMSAKLKNKGLEVTGFDAEEEAIRWARKKVEGCNFRHAEIETFGDDPYDYILCQDVIEHVVDPKQVVALFENHCKNYMILSTDNPDIALRRYDYHRFSVQDLKKLFNKHKVELIKQFEHVYLVKITKG